MEVSCQPHDPDTLRPGIEPRAHWRGGGLGIQIRSGSSGEEMKLLAPARNQTPDRVHIMDYGKGNTSNLRRRICKYPDNKALRRQVRTAGWFTCRTDSTSTSLHWDILSSVLLKQLVGLQYHPYKQVHFYISFVLFSHFRLALSFSF